MLGFPEGSQARVMTGGRIPPRTRDTDYDTQLDALLADAAAHAIEPNDTVAQLAWITQCPNERAQYRDEIVSEAIRVLKQRMDDSEFQVWTLFLLCNPDVRKLADAMTAKHRQHASAEAVAA